MSTEVLKVQPREKTGKLNNRRLRAEGLVPAVLYGHGEDCINLQVSARDIETLLRSGTHVVNLQGAVSDTAMLKDLQWDTYGIDMLHLDLLRVSAKEKIEVTLEVHLRGDAPGLAEGGMVEHVNREVAILCPATSVPEFLELKVLDLHLGGTLTAAQIPLPEGAELAIPPETAIVTCSQRSAEEEEPQAEAPEGTTEAPAE